MLALAASLATLPWLERGIAARLTAEAARRGLVLRIGHVRVGLRPLVQLSGVQIEKPGLLSASIETVDVGLRLSGSGLVGRARTALGRVVADGPARLHVEVEPTTWDLVASGGRVTGASLHAPSESLSVAWRHADDVRLELTALEAPLGRWVAIRRGGQPLLDPGVVTGTLRGVRSPSGTAFSADVAARGLRFPALSGDDGGFGAPTEARLRGEGTWDEARRALEVRRWSASIDGAALSGGLSLQDVGVDPRVDLALEVERVDFARLFRTSGLPRPSAAALEVGDVDDLGSAALSARVAGRVNDPASFSVTQRLEFTPPRRLPGALARLRGDFVHEVVLPDGRRKSIDVSPESPDFVALADVPPLFLRTLLIAEDAGFYGHRGIDLAELPAAILTDWARGRPARGASTITQQLAKNLFLSREKQIGRKLQELSLALLLESALGKQRILEIYLNVIEWGPELYGLRPAARHYFGVEPKDLTPRQAAFLVALIPGPIKYQSSIVGGAVLPGFRPLVDDLLVKLRSLDALDEEQYQAALAEELRIRTAEP